MKYYKDDSNKLYIDPIVENHIGLIEITKEEADLILAPTQEELDSTQMALLEGMIDPHIMKPIDDYNLANGLKFGSPQNCELWSRDDTYEHQAFCLSAWEYHKNVYIAVRAFQLSATTIPTVAEFQVVLDSVTF